VPADTTARWTPEQLDAIEARGTDVLVSAAAGSGKTSVLVERLIRKLLDGERPLSVDRVLVVTFTEAAAAEMKERIRKALLSAAETGSREAVRQLALLGRANISTLHSFCLGILRRHFHLVGLDPQFRVLDQEEAGLLRAGVMDELFEDAHGGALSEAIAGLDGLLFHYGGSRDDRELRRIVAELYEYACSLPDGEAWLARAKEAWTGGDGGAAFRGWQATLRRAALADVEQALADLREARALCALGRGPDTYEPSFAAAGDALEQVARLLESGEWDACVAGLRSVPWPRLKNPGEDADPLLAERARALWDRAKEAVRALMNGAFCRTEAEYARDAELLVPVVSSLCGLVAEFGRRFAAAKRKAGAVDFSDLERLALAVLERDEGRVAAECRDAFDEVLVDEYQDVNPVQDRLIALVSRQEPGRRNRFMVGDVKQSIYRFRLADPEIFQEKHDRFADPADSENRRIDLSANFRCHPEIVGFVNYVFRQLMRRETCGIEYGPEAFLRAHGKFEPGGPSPRVEVHFIERLDDEEGEPGLSAVEREAAVTGRIIRSLVDGEEGAGGGFAYRDIAILMRSPKGRATRFAEVLESMGIPVYARSGSGYFSAVEVEVVLSLLRVLDNPRQDIPLAAVLRSPIGGMTSRDLAEIRAGQVEGTFADAVFAAAGKDSELGRRVGALLQRIDRWRTAARRQSLSRLLWQIYHETGYVDFAAALPRGRQREANLWGLYHRAKRFDQFRTQGLDRFLAYVDGLEESGEEIAPPPALGESENVVQLISVHQSKGLEFPVVIVADLDRQWNLDEAKRSIAYHRRLGVAPCVIDRHRRIRYPSLAHRAVAVQAERDALAEEMRLLYVALTRAKERLVLVGSARDLASRAARWSESALRRGWPLTPGEALGARSWLDWIGRALARHRSGDAIRALGAGDLGPEYYEPQDRAIADCDVAFSVRIWGGREADNARLGAEEPAGGVEAVRNEEVARGPEAHSAVAAFDAPEPATGSGSETPEPGAGKSGGETALWSELDRLYGWSYPLEALTRAPAKVTVTELTRALEPDGDEAWEAVRRPMARPLLVFGQSGVSAAERGTAVHLVLSRVLPANLADPVRLGAEIRALERAGVLSREQAEAVDAHKIAAFFQSPLGRRIIRAPRLWRELSFTMRLEEPHLVQALLGGEELPEGVAAAGGGAGLYRPVVQGAIDCLAVDREGALVVDYKTDRVRSGEEKAAAVRHAGQALLYQKFAARWLGVPAVEAFIVFLETGAAVRVDEGRVR